MELDKGLCRDWQSLAVYLKGKNWRNEKGGTAQSRLAYLELWTFTYVLVEGLGSFAPITRFAPLMGNGDDEGTMRRDFIDDRVREPTQHQTPKPAVTGRARLRGMMHTVETTANLKKEVLSKTGQLCFIETSCAGKLGLGRRMYP